MLLSYKDASGVAHWPDANQGSQKYYAVDWDDYLTAENDTISTITWTVPTGLTSMDESQAANQARIKLSADTVGIYEVTCTIASIEAGETQLHKQVMNLKVK